MTEEMSPPTAANDELSPRVQTNGGGGNGAPHRLPPLSSSSSPSRLDDATERGTRALAAKHACVALKQDVSFWTNRMRLLRKEVHRQQAKQERSSTLRERTELSTFVNLSLREQLEEERRRHEAKLSERADVIRHKRSEHKVALKNALRRTYEEKVERSHMSKLQGSNHVRMIQNTKYEKLVSNIEKKEKVQQEKILGLLKRVKDKARQSEEVHTTFENKIKHSLENEREYRMQVNGLVQQSAELVKKLRKFQEESQVENDKIEALRATAMLTNSQQGDPPISVTIFVTVS